jgi:hypothetical protein
MFWSGDRCTTFDQLNNRYFIQKDRTTISNPDTLFIYNIDSNILIKKLLATIPGTYTPVYSGEAFDEPVAISSIATGTVRIYPNPVAGTLYIDAKEKGRLHIYAPNGQLQLESTIEKGNNTISLNTLPAANYMVVVEMPAEIYATQIVKQ